jgi:predicted metal-binding protein
LAAAANIGPERAAVRFPLPPGPIGRYKGDMTTPETTPTPKQTDRDGLIRRGLELGADHVVPFTIEQIVFDPRTILKCMFGCDDWGRGHTCPSRANSLRPWEYEQVLRYYSWGLIVHSTRKAVAQETSYTLEREAFLAGFPLAFSMSDCALCGECAGFVGEPCRQPKKARPAFHSVGIDVFKTVHQFDLPLEPLKNEDDTQNWYSAVFVE